MNIETEGREKTLACNRYTVGHGVSHLLVEYTRNRGVEGNGHKKQHARGPSEYQRSHPTDRH